MKQRIRIQIVVIDDDASICRQLDEWLSAQAYDVVTFTEPTAGLHHVLTTPPELALVDLRLPDADGADVVATLHEASPRTRIVAMSAFPDPQQVSDALKAGAADLIAKPIEQQRLLEALDQQLVELGIVGRTEHDFNRQLGARLRMHRKLCGRTQSEISTQSGITAAQLSQIELGKTATSTWTLARICGSLRIPMSDVFSRQ